MFAFLVTVIVFGVVVFGGVFALFGEGFGCHRFAC